MCNNELWFFLGLVLIFTLTNAELQADEDIEISDSSGEPNNKLAENDSHTNHSSGDKNSTSDTDNRRKIDIEISDSSGEPNNKLAENDSHTNHSSGDKSSTSDTDNRRKIAEKVAFGNETALRENTPYTLAFWDGPASTATEKNRKGKKKYRKNIDEEEELHHAHHHHRRHKKAGKKESDKANLRGRHEVGYTRAIWDSNAVEGLDIEEPTKKVSRTKEWPKLAPHSNRHKKNKKKDTTRRLSPMFLMQKPGETDERKSTEIPIKEVLRKNKVDDEINKLFNPPQLSPYSIKHEMLSMAKKFTGINISVEVIGKTVEYNDIVLLKASDPKLNSRAKFRTDDDKYIDDVPEKKILFIVHGLNVQGMAAVPCLSQPRAVQKLLSYYFAHLDNFDIFLMPMANPDGFAYVKSKPLWSKNRSLQNACPGVNVDRNFDVGWADALNVSSCSQLYPGPSPFSERESRAVRDVLHKYSHKIIAYINVHAGMDDFNTFKGDAVLYPRGSSEPAVDDDRYIDLRFELDEMMRNASFQVVTVGMETLNSWYGTVAGTSVDYASEVYGVPYALEFAMQVYDQHPMDDDEPDISFLALSEIWRRVIDTVLNNIVLKTGTACLGDGCVH